MICVIALFVSLPEGWVCGSSWVLVLTLVFPLQYGMLLYQNYRIPQQRKGLAPPFNAPMVSGVRALNGQGYGNHSAACLACSYLWLLFWNPWMLKSFPSEDTDSITTPAPRKHRGAVYYQNMILKTLWYLVPEKRVSYIIEEPCVYFPKLMPPSMVFGDDQPSFFPFLSFFLNKAQSHFECGSV